MSTRKFIPNFIRKTMTYKTHDILTAQEYNAILNLLITQGDYNAQWLDYMYNTYIPETVLGMNDDALTEKINRRIAAIAAANVNKTYNILNAPMFSFLDVSIQSSLVGFRNLLDNYDIPGTVCIATNMLDTSAAFPTLANMKALYSAGHAIIPVGTDGSPLNNVDATSLERTLNTVEAFMTSNGLGKPNTFMYPSGLTSKTLVDVVSSKYDYAVNTSVTHSDIDTEIVLNTLYNIPVVFITSATDTAVLKAYIDDTIATNRYCIFAVDSGSSTYSAAKLEEIIKYVQANVATVVTTIPAGLDICINTINNRFRRVDTVLRGIDATLRSVDERIKNLVETVQGIIDALGGLKLSYKDGNFYISNGTKTKKLGSSEGTATTSQVLSGATFNSANTPDNLDYSTGTMPNRGQAQYGKALVMSGDYVAINALPGGYYSDNAEARISKDALGHAYKNMVLEGNWFSSATEGICIQGTMTNNGGIVSKVTPNGSEQSVAIPWGFHNGAGKVFVDAVPYYPASKIIDCIMKKGWHDSSLNPTYNKVVVMKVDETVAQTINFGYPIGASYHSSDKFWYDNQGFIKDGTWGESAENDWDIKRADTSDCCVIAIPQAVIGSYSVTARIKAVAKGVTCGCFASRNTTDGAWHTYRYLIIVV